MSGIFPSYLLSLFQNESLCKVTHIKKCSADIFIFMDFHAKSFLYERFARKLVLKQRRKVARKWPIWIRLVKTYLIKPR